MERIKDWLKYSWLNLYVLGPVELLFHNLGYFFSNLWYYRKMLWRDHDWDYSYLLRLEQIKIRKLSKTIDGHVDSERMRKLMKVCMNLIDIIINDGLLEDEDEADVYINDKNYSRFLPLYGKFRDQVIQDVTFGDKECYLQYMKLDLRAEKAFVLYHRIRQAYLRKWWC